MKFQKDGFSTTVKMFNKYKQIRHDKDKISSTIFSANVEDVLERKKNGFDLLCARAFDFTT